MLIDFRWRCLFSWAFSSSANCTSWFLSSVCLCITVFICVSSRVNPSFLLIVLHISHFYYLRHPLHVSLLAENWVVTSFDKFRKEDALQASPTPPEKRYFCWLFTINAFYHGLRAFLTMSKEMFPSSRIIFKKKKKMLQICVWNCLIYFIIVKLISTTLSKCWHLPFTLRCYRNAPWCVNQSLEGGKLNDGSCLQGSIRPQYEAFFAKYLISFLHLAKCCQHYSAVREAMLLTR